MIWELTSTPLYDLCLHSRHSDHVSATHHMSAVLSCYANMRRNLQVSWQCAATSEVPDWWFACSIACPGHPFWLRVCVGRRNAIWRNAHSRSPGSAGRTRRPAAVSSSWLATCRGGMQQHCAALRLWSFQPELHWSRMREKLNDSSGCRCKPTGTYHMMSCSRLVTYPW